MSNLVEHAKRELQMIIDDCKTQEEKEMQEYFSKQIVEIVELFSDHNHSGFSAKYALNILEKLLDYKPLKPLTGEDDEWVKHVDGTYQNKRCSHVFKGSDRFNGKPYTLYGKTFSYDGGETWFTNGNSFEEIEFPYVPKKPKRVILDGE